MRILAWLTGRLRGERVPADLSDGWHSDFGPGMGIDGRDPYGFGHRAHQPDPKAHYGFENDPNYRIHHPEVP